MRTIAIDAVLNGSTLTLGWDDHQNSGNWALVGRSPTSETVVQNDSAWPTTPVIGLPSEARSWTTDLSPGQLLEYRISRSGAEGYILAGIDVPMVENRGTVLLVVDETQLDATRPGGVSLQPALDRQKLDLIGDGWKVKQINVARADVPRTNPPNEDPATITSFFANYRNAVTSTKAAIRAVYDSTPDLKAVVLVGHVAVPYAGSFAPDGHADHVGAWPADGYYGVMDAESVWTDMQTFTGQGTRFPENYNRPGDGKWDQKRFSELLDGTIGVGLAVGRIDFFNLPRFTGKFYTDPGVIAAAPIEETNALKVYFDRLHRFRIADPTIDPIRRAGYDGQFTGPHTAWRYGPLVGRANDSPIRFSNSVNGGSNDHDLATGEYLWAAAEGGVSHIERRGADDERVVLKPVGTSTNLLADSAYAFPDLGPDKSVFNVIFGSYVGDWDKESSLLRSSMADPDGFGLTATWGNWPTWFFHRMGLGATIGSSLLITQNDAGGYLSFDPDQRGTHVSLLGDPTLRMHYLRPPTNVGVGPAPQGYTGRQISWQASPEPGIIGYHVYHADSIDGNFTRITTSPVQVGTNSYITGVPAGDESVYMVRALKLETTPSGSYHNLSTGTLSGPLVQRSEFWYETTPHKVFIDFTEPVVSSVTSGIVVEQLSTLAGTNTPPLVLTAGTHYTAAYDATAKRVTVTFLMNNTDTNSTIVGAVPSGRYRVSIAAGAIISPDGRTPLTGHTDDFLFLAADANNDGFVNTTDYNIMRAHFGQTGSLFSDGDFDYDGDVDIGDWNILLQVFGDDV